MVLAMAVGVYETKVRSAVRSAIAPVNEVMLVEHLLRGREPFDPLAWAVRFVFGSDDQGLTAQGA
ncbi:hypothetical protein OOK58_00915 [Streptomyces sp. NBC_01728]|nr:MULTISPECIES: hypothetical protein [unclassified Streptomyces]MCX4461276.1 hypothetical protein [Streptomyces sp. NBC_01719]MCX4490184.1 hypothetical protein [Streptomyces sp. NBC_01728]MCX4596999.1 hypothetical protein [Streptomyces sp. NBC_01549]